MQEEIAKNPDKVEFLKDTQKRCCAPSISNFEKKAMDPPLNSENRMIFPWNYTSKSYNTNSFQPAKASFLDHNSLYSVLNQIENGVENYDVEKIKPNCCVVWGVTFVIFAATVLCCVIVLLTDFYWGIVITVVIIGLAIYSMWSNIANERRRTTEKVMKRKEAIDAVLQNWSQTTGRSRNIFMETGD